MITSRSRKPKLLQLKLLESVVDFMLSAGISEASLRQSFERSLLRAHALHVKRVRDHEGAYLPYADISADLLRLWHRDSRLLTPRDARPRPLHLTKGRNSIRSLLKSLSAGANYVEIESFLKSARLISRTSDGRYIPATPDASTITHDAPFVVEHLARSMLRLFTTVRRNRTFSTEAPSLIERYAYVSDLNENEREAFAMFSKAQGLAYLQAVDDWMEHRRISKSRAKRFSNARGVVAGVQVITYLDDMDLERRTRNSGSLGRGNEGSDQQE